VFRFELLWLYFLTPDTWHLHKSLQSLLAKPLNADPRNAGSGTGPKDQVFDVEESWRLLLVEMQVFDTGLEKKRALIHLFGKR
jgi:hypothetical protein